MLNSIDTIGLKPLESTDNSNDHSHSTNAISLIPPMHILPSLYQILELSSDQIQSLQNLNEEIFPNSSEWCLLPDGKVLAGSFHQLVIFLTLPDTTNLDFQEQFLISYPSFSSPRMVLSAIFTRFFPDLSKPKCNIEDENELKRTRDRIIRIISQWVKITPYQFDEPMIEALDQFQEYIHEHTNFAAYVKIIEAAVNILHGNSILFSYSSAEPPPMELPSIPVEQWSLLNIPPLEVARQITIFHSNTFRSIGPMEVLTEIWGEGKTGGSPHINLLTEHFNKFSSYVTYTVISPQNKKERSAIHEHWIDVASAFEQLHNYHGMFAVYFGLEHRAVSRMTKVVASSLCSSKQRKNAFLKISEITSLTKDFAVYREIIDNTVGACVPYIGCIQKDLIYVQETYKNSYYGIINFEKCVHCVDLMKKMKRFQNDRYSLKPHQNIQEILLNLPEPMETTALMKLSMEREPKHK